MASVVAFVTGFWRGIKLGAEDAGMSVSGLAVVFAGCLLLMFGLAALGWQYALIAAGISMICIGSIAAGPNPFK